MVKWVVILSLRNVSFHGSPDITKIPILISHKDQCNYKIIYMFKMSLKNVFYCQTRVKSYAPLLQLIIYIIIGTLITWYTSVITSNLCLITGDNSKIETFGNARYILFIFLFTFLLGQLQGHSLFRQRESQNW